MCNREFDILRTIVRVCSLALLITLPLASPVSADLGVLARESKSGSSHRSARGYTQVCGSSGDHLVVARGVQAMVYRAEKPDLEYYGYWGCVYGRKRSLLLGRELVSGSPYASFGIKDVTLAGDVVAYEVSFSSSPLGVNESLGSMEEGKSERYVVVINLLSGRVLHKVPTGTLKPTVPKVIGAGETRAIVVKSDASVAWINDKFKKENRYEVHALDKAGDRVLAVGSNIAPTSLALAGSTLYWTQGGKPMSARLD